MNNSNYRVLARKYRPQNFAELRGQEVLVKVLTYAIKNQKLAQGYLLTGIRGIGKTTSARIIAKTINCLEQVFEDNLVLACEKCSNCREFNSGSHPDIMEIDAASRTSVDDIRVIIENAEYKPLLGKIKVFIIDEIHMLSKSAFNALLKLLEEPPAHVLFIFATTEVHKIPLTIISRCQRFDLARFSTQELIELFKHVSVKENIEFEIDALELLAYKADGSARDGLSMLDQAALLCNNQDNKITKAIIEQMIGVTDRTKVLEFLNAIINNNAEEALLMLHKIYQHNSDLTSFVNELLVLLHYLAKKISIQNFSSSEFQNIEPKISFLSTKTNMNWLQIAWQLSFKAMQELKVTSSQLQLLEMLALKLIYATTLSHKNVTQESSSLSKELPRPDSLTNFAIKNLSNDSKLDNEASDKGAHIVNQNLINFLRFLNHNFEFELYYFLFNQVEVIEFTSNQMIINALTIPKSYLSELKEQLNKWQSVDWQVTFEIVDDVNPLKEIMKNKFKQTTSWQKLVKSFAEVEVIDILMQTK